MDNIRLLTLTDENRDLFVKTLEIELIKAFGVNSVADLPENYSDRERWSLIRMIREKRIDSYQLIYVNDQFWSGSGGLVRQFNGPLVYQGGFRAFADAKSINVGIGCKSYSHEYNTKFQIERAKELGCVSLVLSFNDSNKRLFEVTQRYHLKKVFGKNAFIATDTPVLFNGVEQWLLTMSLK